MSESTTFFKDGMRKLLKNPLAVGSIIVLILIISAAVVGPMIIPYGYEEMIQVNGRRDKTAKNLGPMEWSKNEQKAIDSGEKLFPHLLGTDEDVYKRQEIGLPVASRMAGKVMTASVTYGM